MKRIILFLGFTLFFSQLSYCQNSDKIIDTNIIRILDQFNKVKPKFEKIIKSYLIEKIKLINLNYEDINDSTLIKDIENNKFQFCIVPFYNCNNKLIDFTFNNNIGEYLYLDSLELPFVIILRDNEMWFLLYPNHNKFVGFEDYHGLQGYEGTRKHYQFIASLSDTLIFYIKEFGDLRMFIKDNKIMTGYNSQASWGKLIDLNDIIRNNYTEEEIRQKAIK